MPRRAVMIALLVIVFAVVSFALARILAVNGLERDRVVALIRVEARGDAAGMLERLPDCRRAPACARGVRALAARLARAGPVRVLRYDATASFTVGSRTGEARIAWAGADGRPVIQCVRLRREVRILSRASVTLLRPSGPLESEASC